MSYMTRTDLRIKFNTEKDLNVLQTDGTGYIHYTDDYVHWLEEIALKQSNGDKQSDSNCNIPLVSKNGVAVCDTDFKCTGCGGTTVLGYCEHGCDD